MTASRHSEQPGSDLYRVLGLDPDASSDEIARAYRRLARHYHPDVDTTPGAASRFAEVTRAYRVLADPKARARYDAGRIPRRAGPPSDAGYSRGSCPPWPATRVRPDRIPHDAFWLAAAGLTPPFHLNADLPVRSPRDDETELELTLQESYQGTTRTVTVTSQDSSESIHVVVPPGTIDGDRIEVPTISPRGGGNTPPVVLRVRLVPPEGYRLDGRDLHVQLTLSPWEAALGATITLDTPAGPVSIDVPPGTCSGRVLTVPAHGIPNPNGPFGNLHATLTSSCPPG
ncbi:MAG TPA: DnaJ C-terminal domain-containing protein [Phycicoccus elongatus]|uniref:DnaJ C-terminal domain-containing protein n=1 Tax=Phycicoccus TaxID=367298 RepID=UPI001D657BAB|nr:MULTISPECIES: DnaJ C-terminal domain-containing protein [Phycicoccus]MCB1240224.1 DnaJ domain-containing protein [Tetrasphaera sp.]MCB9407083.1 DnaJ domain-containing protein [Tetrasphaera sp.]MCO5303207.1 DnaJ domain-containing protein [Phycicoccus sp.]HPK11402.1 DnaJ C-terminal domain-containing protein [Phycicoccus elongatus]HPQ72424.1 DnaJ C-terminal domain-containing protein [Phycicoccus elongatus]